MWSHTWLAVQILPLRPLVPRTPTHSSGGDPRSHFPDALPQPFQTPSGMSPYCIVTTLNRRLLRSFTNISHGCNLKVKPHAPPAVRFALAPQWASSLRGSAGAKRCLSAPRVLSSSGPPCRPHSCRQQFLCITSASALLDALF